MKKLSTELGEQYIPGDSSDKDPRTSAHSGEMDQGLKNELLRLMLEGLSRKQKLYLVLYYRQGLTMTEIASKMGVSVSTVSRTITRARRNLTKEAGREALRRLLG